MKFILFLLTLNSYSSSIINKLYKDLGLKLRLGAIYADHELNAEGVQLSEAEFDGKGKFPIIPVFRSKDGRKTYTQIFFDYEFPAESINQMAKSGTNRSKIKSMYLNGSALSFINDNPNWNLSGDVETWSVAAGYQWGAFIRLSDSSRLFKIGAGPILGYLNYKYTLNLCSSYIENPKVMSLNKISSGTCNNKKKIDELGFSGFGFGLAANFTIYELIKKNGHLVCLTLRLES